ncbi:DNA-binding protein [Niveibacterium sp. SC-1]|uniref:DNA-binding protein n=1 Tax=Niveibacterium sp. SC-1 TaxID=3135646 RepID=UPI00312018D1
MREIQGSRGGVDQEAVTQAADALLRTGQRPTVDKVRAQIGRGSPNTITPLLDVWFKSLGDRLEQPARSDEAAAIPDPIGVVASDFWKLALNQARAQVLLEFEGERLLLAGDRTDLLREHADLDQARHDFEVRCVAFETYQHSLVEERTAAREEAQRLVGELATAQRRYAQSEHEQQMVLNTHRVRIAYLEQELRATREAGDTERRAMLVKIDEARTELGRQAERQATTFETRLAELRLQHGAVLELREQGYQAQAESLAVERANVERLARLLDENQRALADTLERVPLPRRVRRRLRLNHPAKRITQAPKTGGD